MLSLSPSRDDRDAREQLQRLIIPCRSAAPFRSHIRHLYERFHCYAATCPAPLPAPGLFITPEIRIQSELYLPITEIAAAFNHLYQTALTSPPVLDSTPFHTALSWADACVALPQRFWFGANPARLLENLLSNQELQTDFLFESFLPRRFYGGFRRYPGQREFVRSWLSTHAGTRIRCLDAACGTGEDSYGLALLLLENGWSPAEFRIEGWTIEPLEVLGAAFGRFPHDPERELMYRRETEPVFARKAEGRIQFRAVDLRELSSEHSPFGEQVFDLILCNGLLGGPILHKQHDVQRVIAGLAGLLAPGGMILTADTFHGGWKQKHPQEWLRVHLESFGLEVGTAGDGLYAIRS